MRKCLLVGAVCLFFSALKGFAFTPEKAAPPDTLRKSLKQKQAQNIWLNVGQLTRSEVQLSYERFLSPWISLELGLGYKYAKPYDKIYKAELSTVLMLDTYDYAERMPFSEGVLVSLNFKLYPPGKKDYSGFYVSGQFFYRYRWYDYKFITSYTLQPDDRYEGNSLQSLDLNIYGGKLLIGNAIELVRFRNNSGILLDVYAGTGIRHKSAKTTYYYSGSAPLPPALQAYFPHTERAEANWGSLHAGVKIGYQF